MMTTPTANPRWRFKPCTACGENDWMFGRKHLCASCRIDGEPLPARVSFPPGTIDKMREMRALKTPWKVIAVAFGCDWPTARNHFMTHCGDHPVNRKETLRKIHDAVAAFLAQKEVAQ